MRFRSILAVAVVPVALAAAGCSDDEDTGAEESSTETTAAEGTETAATETTAAPADGEGAVAVLPMGTPPEGDTSELNIAQIATGTSAVTTLTQLVVKSGLVATLRDGGPFTVFAPVNEAFAALPPETLISVTEDNATLTQVLTLHVVPGTYKSTDLMDLDGQTLTTVEGGKLLVEMDGDDVIVGGAKVISPDIEASNGMIHAVDSVIASANG
ncbi:MAG: fasciclin domain-containing protein [Microthrixaceae bacterium]